MFEDFYNSVMSHKTIFTLMYSPYREKELTLEEQIVDIDTDELRWADDKSCFFYIWGWPGPDFNKYTPDTYGKGWAFTKEEIFDAWGDN